MSASRTNQPGDLQRYDVGMSGRQYDQSQLFVLDRLARFVDLRNDQLQAGESDPLKIRLVSKAIYSAFCDSVSLGVGDVARELVRQQASASN